MMDYAPAAEVRVIDGDTLRIGAERIRLINIDAPEMSNGAECDAERQLAEVAKQKMTEIVAGQQLQVRREDKDRFGRTLAYIRVRGADLGEMLVMARVAVRWEGRQHDWCGASSRGKGQQ
jgi:endonuclease YncB( thermonuclease family)